MIIVTLPNIRQMATGLALGALYGATAAMFRNPLHISGDEPDLPSRDELLGAPALTSLALRLGEAEIILTECVMTVTQSRNIVTTALQGRNGTIKEYISDGDYQIEAAAAIQPPETERILDPAGAQADLPSMYRTPEDRYPYTELTALLSMFRAAGALEVQSDYLSLFDIKSAVVSSYSLVQQTHANRQEFRLSLLSDLPYEIKMAEDARA
jgi:hypothetical protein